jgi:uncharacterized coiled-coil DUF342 family protein
MMLTLQTRTYVSRHEMTRQPATGKACSNPPFLQELTGKLQAAEKAAEASASAAATLLKQKNDLLLAYGEQQRLVHDAAVRNQAQASVAEKVAVEAGRTVREALIAQHSALSHTLQTRLDAACQESVQLHASAGSHKSEVALLHEQLASCKAEVVKVQQDAGIHQGEAAQLRRELTSCKAEVAKMQEDACSHKSEVVQLRGQLASVKAEAAEMREDAGSYKHEVMQLLGKLTSYKAEAAKMQEETGSHKSEIAHLQGELASCKAEAKMMQEDVCSHESEFVQLRQELAGCKAEAAKTREDAGSHKSEVARLQEQLARCTSELAQMLEDAGSDKSEVIQLRQELTGCKAEAAKMQEDAGIYKSEVSRLQDQLEDACSHESEVVQLRRELAGCKAEAAKTREDAGIYKSEVAQVQEQLASCTEEAADVREDAGSHGSEVVHSPLYLHNAMAEFRGEVVQLGEDACTHETEIAQLQEELASCKMVVAQLRQDVGGHKSAVAHLAEKLGDCKAGALQSERDAGGHKGLVNLVQAAQAKRDADVVQLHGDASDQGVIKNLYEELDACDEEVAELQEDEGCHANMVAQVQEQLAGREPDAGQVRDDWSANATAGTCLDGSRECEGCSAPPLNRGGAAAASIAGPSAGPNLQVALTSSRPSCSPKEDEVPFLEGSEVWDEDREQLQMLRHQPMDQCVEAAVAEQAEARLQVAEVDPPLSTEDPSRSTQHVSSLAIAVGRASWDIDPASQKHAAVDIATGRAQSETEGATLAPPRGMEVPPTGMEVPPTGMERSVAKATCLWHSGALPKPAIGVERCASDWLKSESRDKMECCGKEWKALDYEAPPPKDMDVTDMAGDSKDGTASVLHSPTWPPPEARKQDCSTEPSKVACAATLPTAAAGRSLANAMMATLAAPTTEEAPTYKRPFCPEAADAGPNHYSMSSGNTCTPTLSSLPASGNPGTPHKPQIGRRPLDVAATKHQPGRPHGSPCQLPRVLGSSPLQRAPSCLVPQHRISPPPVQMLRFSHPHPQQHASSPATLQYATPDPLWLQRAVHMLQRRHNLARVLTSPSVTLSAEQLVAEARSQLACGQHHLARVMTIAQDLCAQSRSKVARVQGPTQGSCVGHTKCAHTSGQRGAPRVGFVSCAGNVVVQMHSQEVCCQERCPYAEHCFKKRATCASCWAQVRAAHVHSGRPTCDQQCAEKREAVSGSPFWSVGSSGLGHTGACLWLLKGPARLAAPLGVASGTSDD